MAKHAQNGNSHKQSGIALVDAPGRLLTDEQLKRYEGYLAEILPALGRLARGPRLGGTRRRSLTAPAATAAIPSSSRSSRPNATAGQTAG